MSLRRAKSAEEYANWVKQAMFEVGDLKECMLYETEEMLSFPEYVLKLEAGIKSIYDDMCQGTYHFGREDLPFMEVVHANADQIPFHTLLKQINETHRKGLEIDDQDEG